MRGLALPLLALAVAGCDADGEPLKLRFSSTPTYGKGFTATVTNGTSHDVYYGGCTPVVVQRASGSDWVTVLPEASKVCPSESVTLRPGATASYVFSLTAPQVQPSDRLRAFARVRGNGKEFTAVRALSE